MDENTAIPAGGRSGRPMGFVRDEAVEAAMNLFWKKGFLAVSAKDLADAMAIQRSSFYNSFGSREALFLEALQRYSVQAPDAPLAHLQPGQPVVPVLVSFLREVCRVRAADREGRGCLICNGLAELVGVEDTLGPLLKRAVDERVALVDRLLHQAVLAGEMAALADPRAAAEGFVAFLIGLNTLSKVMRDETRLWSVCRQYLAGFGVPAEALGDATGFVPSAGGA